MLIQTNFDVWTQTENTVTNVVPVAGTFDDFRVLINTAPGGAASYVFTLRDNSQNTALTCTITGVATTCSDATHLSMGV